VITFALICLIIAFLLVALFALTLVAGLMDSWRYNARQFPIEPSPYLIGFALLLFLIGAIVGFTGLFRL
jgi:hypothetical protein